MDRAQIAGEKNGVICLVIIFPKLWLEKHQKWLIFIFSADDGKRLVLVLAKYKVHLKDLFEFFQKMVCLICFGVE